MKWRSMLVLLAAILVGITVVRAVGDRAQNYRLLSLEEMRSIVAGLDCHAYCPDTPNDTCEECWCAQGYCYERTSGESNLVYKCVALGGSGTCDNDQNFKCWMIYVGGSCPGIPIFPYEYLCRSNASCRAGEQAPCT